MTYAELTTELEALLRDLERDDLPLDELTEKVQRCYGLIREGRRHLHAAEEAVARVIDEFGADEDDGEEGADTAAEDA